MSGSAERSWDSAMRHIDDALSADTSGELRFCGLHVAACFAVTVYGMADPGDLVSDEEYSIGVLGLRPRRCPSEGWQVVQKGPESLRLGTFQLINALDLLAEIEITVGNARRLLRGASPTLVRLLDHLDAALTACNRALVERAGEG